MSVLCHANRPSNRPQALSASRVSTSPTEEAQALPVAVMPVAPSSSNVTLSSVTTRHTRPRPLGRHALAYPADAPLAAGKSFTAF